MPWGIDTTQPPQNTDTKLEQLPPILTFSDSEEFRTRHKAATKAEFKVHKARINAFNLLNPVLDAWVITAPPEHQPWMGHVFRVDLYYKLPNGMALSDHVIKILEDLGWRRSHKQPKGIDLPGVGQSCKLRIVEDDKTHSPWYPCRRGAEVVTLNQSWGKSTELVVYVDGHDTEDFADHLTPLLDGSSSVRGLNMRNARNIKVQLHLDPSKATMLAKLGALDRLTKGNASKAGKAAFSYLMDFSNPDRDSRSHIKLPSLGGPG